MKLRDVPKYSMAASTWTTILNNFVQVSKPRIPDFLELRNSLSEDFLRPFEILVRYLSAVFSFNCSMQINALCKRSMKCGCLMIHTGYYVSLRCSCFSWF